MEILVSMLCATRIIPSRHSRRLSLTLLIPGLLYAQAPSQDSTELYKKLGGFGVALGGLLYTVGRDNLAGQNDTVTTDQLKASLEQMIRARKENQDNARGALGLLNADLDVVLTGTDIATEGASVLATSGVRWAKEKGLAYVQSQIDDGLKNDLALNVKRLEDKTGLTYDSLHQGLTAGTITTDDLKKDIDESGVFSEAMQQVGDDQTAKGILENAAIDVIRSTEKASLDQIAGNTADIEATRKQVSDGLAGLGKQLSDYTEQTNDTLKDFQRQLVGTQDAIDAANSKLDDLQDSVDSNTQQLQVMGQFMYSHASAQDRLIMMDSGYLKDSLSDMAWQALYDETAAQKKKDELVGDVNRVVGQFSQVCTIAKNLGLPLPAELQTAVTVANTASSVMTDLAGGNVLGALVSFSGLFGAHSDPNAELMAYMQKNFAEVNQKLDVLIKGQQQIMEGLEAISKQIAAYDKALNERLDNFQYELDTIQDLTRSTFYEPLMGCQATQEAIEDVIKQARSIDPTVGALDLTSPKQVAFVANGVGGPRVQKCVEFIQTLYTFAFNDSTGMGFAPLALRYQKKVNPPDFPVSQESLDKYYKPGPFQDFFDNQYKPLHEFIDGQIGAEHLTYASELDANSIPSPDVVKLDKKMLAFSNSADACIDQTVLSDPLVDALCKGSSRDDLKSTKSDSLEKDANASAKQILDNPIMADALTTLADWVIYYTPLYEYINVQNGQLLTRDEFLSQDALLPRGPKLLEGALKTVSVGLAQTNMLYGDVTARILFDTLWNSSTKQFVNTASMSKDQATARGILANNPYFQRNVLMLALDRSLCFKATTSGCVEPQTTNATKALDTPIAERVAYGFAVDWLKSGLTDDTAWLQSLFGDWWTFKVIWKSSNVPDPSQPDDDDSVRATKLAQAVKDADQKCQNATPDAHGTRPGCYPLPIAEILGTTQRDGSVNGIEVPLPSAEAFGTRELAYPQSVLDLVSERDKIAAHLADYATIVSAAKRSSDPVGAGIDLVKALVQTYR